MEEDFKRIESEDDGWTELYRKLDLKSRKHSTDAGLTSGNKFLNRYLNVLPYDRSRVKLSRVADSNYINANLVTLPKAARQYILTQGPLPETIGHFWLMVWEQKTNVIVMLNRCVESVALQALAKCAQYWPEELGESEDYPDVKLTVTLKKVDEQKHFILREIQLTDNESKKTRIVSQFQHKSWPDHDQPDSPTSFLRLLAAIRKSGCLDKMDEPTVVHCSAGIGRSGTFCLIDSILSMIENQGSTEGIDIINTLVEMRDYRMGLIQTPVQLRFAYMCIIYGVKILERAKKLHPHMTSVANSQQQRTNGSSQSNGQKPRRNRKKQSSSANNSINVFNKQLLVEALDDVDSDSADNLFEDSMKQLPNLKKARNSGPESFSEDMLKQLSQYKLDGISYQSSSAPTGSDQQALAAEQLTSTMQSLFGDGSKINPQESSQPGSPVSGPDSVILRRRERELRNQQLAEKTSSIKNRMKAEELKRERHAARVAFMKKLAMYGGVAALILSSVAYFYLNRNQST